MIAIALAAAAVAAPPPQAERPVVRQATATVRILSGARVGPAESPGEALVRKARIREPDGSETVVRLVEFP